MTRSAAVGAEPVRFERAYACVLNRKLDPSVVEDQEFRACIAYLKKEVLEGRATIAVEHRACLRHAFEYTETMLETAAALAGRKAPISRTFDFAKKEGEAAGMTRNSKVLFIGSGPFPETAMAYAQEFGCEVDCLDCCPVAVELSTKVLRGNVFCGWGEAFDLSPYTHIAIAILVKDKERVLRNCLQHTGKTLILRTVDAPGDVIYEPVTPDMLALVKQTATVRGPTIMHTIVATI